MLKPSSCLRVLGLEGPEGSHFPASVSVHSVARKRSRMMEADCPAVTDLPKVALKDTFSRQIKMDENQLYNMTSFFIIDNIPSLMDCYKNNPDWAEQERLRNESLYEESMSAKLPAFKSNFDQIVEELRSISSRVLTIDHDIRVLVKNEAQYRKKLNEAEKAVREAQRPVQHYEKSCSTHREKLADLDADLQKAKANLKRIKSVTPGGELDIYVGKVQLHENLLVSILNEHRSCFAALGNSQTLLGAAKSRLDRDAKTGEKYSAKLKIVQEGLSKLKRSKETLGEDASKLQPVYLHTRATLKNQISFTVSYVKYLLTVDFVNDYVNETERENTRLRQL